MTDPTPISPPTETPISPVLRSTTFSHKTSPAVATQTPLIDTSVPAINAHPVELDGIPTSPQEQGLKRREGGSRMLSPADGDIDAEFLSEDGKGAGQLGREKRAAMLASRSKDPGVIVDVPDEPTADAVEAADKNLVGPGPVHTITRLGKIFTACQDGEIPFVSADDIAEVAFRALTNEKSFDRDLRVFGRELLTYDDVSCREVDGALGRLVEHVKLDMQGRYQNLVQAGLSKYFAQLFTNVEVKASEGLETMLNSVVQDVTGHPPRSLHGFIRENKDAWSS
ncbi:hypothetical protein E8E11_001217 [Didymella keratinophila]|nr:hypothetical protein E8E11_001217 [Didymella keratinophila]